MILSGHQPVYLPSLHLFNKIALSDKFMFVGHCQFGSKSWHCRNVIRNNDGAQILTVPVLKTGRSGQSISETVINGDHWKRKHLASLKNSYRKRPYFEDYFPAIEEIISRPWRTLGPMNIALITQFLAWLEIGTPIFYSEDFGITGQKTNMLINMCHTMGADRYLSNAGARDYVNEAKMRDAGIHHCWQNFTHPVYEQGRKFMANLSIVDCLFNVGPACQDLVLGSGTVDAGNAGESGTTLRRLI